MKNPSLDSELRILLWKMNGCRRVSDLGHALARMTEKRDRQQTTRKGFYFEFEKEGLRS